MIIKKEGQLKQICLIKNKLHKSLKKKSTLFHAGLIFLSMTLLGCQRSNISMQSPQLINDTEQKLESLQQSIKGEELKWEWIIRPEEYEDVIFIDYDMLAVKGNNGKYSIVNTKKEKINTALYDEISEYKDGMALVKMDENYFFIDREGNHLFNEFFEDAYSFSNGFAAVKKNNAWGFINKSGSEIINCQFEQVNSFKENLASVRTNNKWGFINNSGNIIIPCQYDVVKDFNERRAAVMKDNKWGFVDTSGKIISDCQYDSVNNFQEGYASVMKNGKWGFINESGEVCIDMKYDEAADFSEGKAAVKVTNYQDGLDEWAYINKNDNVVIDFYPYDASEGRMIWVGEFKDGLAFVSKTLYCVIDDKGNDVFSGDSEFFISTLMYYPRYDAIPGYIFTDDKMTVKKYGLMGLSGNERLKPVFDYIQGIYGDFAIVENIVNGEYRKGIIQIFDN